MAEPVAPTDPGRRPPRTRRPRPRRCAPTRRAGLTADAQGAAAEVVLRRPRAARCSRRSRELPEYYPTRTERAILDTRAPARSRRSTGADTLVELGSGTSEKTRLLLDALAAAGTLRRVRAVRRERADAARRGGRDRRASTPGIEVHAVVGDFERHLGQLPGGGDRLVAFLGSTIGNLAPADAGRLPRRAGARPATRRLVPARHRPGQGRRPARRRLRRRRRRHRGVQPQRARACSTASSTPTSTRAASPTWPAGTTDEEWIEMRLRADGDPAGAGPSPRPRRRVRRRRGDAHRDQRQVPAAAASRPSWPPPGSSSASWWTDPAGDFALSLAGPSPDFHYGRSVITIGDR